MTKRLTPEQAALTPEIIAEIRALDAADTKRAAPEMAALANDALTLIGDLIRGAQAAGVFVSPEFHTRSYDLITRYRALAPPDTAARTEGSDD